MCQIAEQRNFLMIPGPSHHITSTFESSQLRSQKSWSKDKSLFKFLSHRVCEHSEMVVSCHYAVNTPIVKALNPNFVLVVLHSRPTLHTLPRLQSPLKYHLLQGVYKCLGRPAGGSPTAFSL